YLRLNFSVTSPGTRSIGWSPIAPIACSVIGPATTPGSIGWIGRVSAMLISCGSSGGGLPMAGSGAGPAADWGVATVPKSNQWGAWLWTIAVAPKPMNSLALDQMELRSIVRRSDAHVTRTYAVGRLTGLQRR